ncbi:YadA-like family protein [Pseudomonas canadensis]|uniref:YadA-like family protein n=1 Tax=Pseudomonas canadensis TaxID=915099 RepID=UPI002734570B|nr:YadA-like family protein [Pseudomonas canadensis]WLH29941.1 YadA-like family protein [Pseudomonas canadensis]
MHINANPDAVNSSAECVSLNDPQSSYTSGSTSAISSAYLSENLTWRDGASAKCHPNSKAGQFNSVLIYRPTEAAGEGATSMSLGGELYVNSGRLMLGIPDGSLSIGHSGERGDVLASNGGIAMGRSAQAIASGSIALGQAAKATNTQALAFGNSASASFAYALAFGSASAATGEGATIFGPSSLASGQSSFAGGRFAQPLGTSSVALGRSTIARGVDSLALGYSAVAPLVAAVALGNNSTALELHEVAPVTLNGTSYSFDSTKAVSTFSIGGANTRLLINLASGSVSPTSTDAINGAQLFALYDSTQRLGDREMIASQSVVDALGSGPLSEGSRVVLPPLSLVSLGPEVTQPTSALGALKALDRAHMDSDQRLGGAFDSAFATVQAFEQLDLSGRMRWNAQTGVYDATHVDTEHNKIIDLAAGTANLDAINKGQLDRVEGSAREASQAADAAATLAFQARDSAAAVESAAQRAQATAAQAERDADQARQAADTAQSTANNANDAVAKAQATANTAQGDANAANESVAQARQTTERAQRDAVQASQQAVQADQTAAAAQEQSARAAGVADQARTETQAATLQAELARDTASQVHAEAEQARRSASAAERAAAGAQTAVDDARRSADSALVAGHDVQADIQTAQDRANAAQTAALSAQAMAESAQATGNDAAALAAGAQTATRAAQNDADTALNDAVAAQQSADGAQATADRAQDSVLTTRDTAASAQATGDRAAASASIAQQRAQTAQSSADAAQAYATDVVNAAEDTQTHADHALEVAKAARQGADRALEDADATVRLSGVAQQAADASEARAGQAQTSAVQARQNSETAQATANQASIAAGESRRVAGAAQLTVDHAVDTASVARRGAGQAQETAERASTIGVSARRAAESVENTAQIAADSAASAHQAADAALITGQTAQELAAQAQRNADAGTLSATGALDAAQQARQAAELAQDTADSAVTASGNARKAADAARSTADSAQETANTAHQHADSARDTADQAFDAAGGAQRTGESAQGTADNAKAGADLTASQLQGVGASETVVERIDGAIQNAAGTASDFLARILGGGAGIGVDGKPVAPSYTIGELAVDGSTTPSTHNNVGDAQSRLDGNLRTINNAVQAQTTGLDDVKAQTLGQRVDNLLWDETSGRYIAGRGDQRETPARIGNLADGLAPTDAVNNRQLEGAQGIADSATDLASGARDSGTRAEQTGDNAQAASARVHLAADTANQSADSTRASARATQQTAERARLDADQIGRVAQRALGQLQGLAKGESVLDRLKEGARAGSQALANAMGADASVNADATLLAPSFALGTSGITTSNVGQALEGLDGGVAKANDQAVQASNDVRELRELAAEGKVGLVRQDVAGGDIQIARNTDGARVDVNGGEGPRSLGGIQEGVVSAESSDAVTGRQLNTVKQRIELLDQQRLGLAVDNGGDGSENAHAAPESRALSAGANAQGSGGSSVAVGAGAQSQADRSTVTGADATANAANSVALGSGSQANRADSVAVGNTGRERQITQVADATQRTDAVSLRQATVLSNQAAEQSLRQSNTYTDRRVGQMSQDVYAGVASAMAMAGLPAASSSGKSMLAIATAVYENQPAVAVGLTARSRSGRWTYGATGTGTARGDYAVTMAVGYHW